MKFTVLTLLTAGSLLSGCSMIQQARLNTAKQEFAEELPNKCGTKAMDKKNVVGFLACHDDLLIEKFEGAGYPYMAILYSLKADNQQTAAAYADGKITENEAKAQVSQHIAQASLIEQQLNTQAQAAHAERMARLGDAMQTFSAQMQQNAQFNQQQMMLNRPVTTNCNSLGSSVNCTTW